MKNKRIMSALSLIVVLSMLIGMIPWTALSIGAVESVIPEGAVEDEYPKEAAYDFFIPGSTIRFFDKNGTLLKEEAGWSEGEAVCNVI